MAGLRRGWLSSKRATAATEFALIAPVLLLFIGGVVEFGRIFEAYSVTNRLATQYAIAYADCSDYPAGTCSTEISNYTAANAIANFAPQLVASQLTLQMFQLSMSGTTPTIVYAYPTGATLSAAQTAAAQAAFSNGQSGVLVTATYTHSLIFFSAIMSTYLGRYLTPTYTVTQLKS